MTEDEAKTKWCFAAVASHTDPRMGFHPPDADWPQEQPKTFACIGSACMAWRWSAAQDTEGFMALVRSKLGDGDNYQKVLNAALKEHRATFEHTEGFCGLAGGAR